MKFLVLMAPKAGINYATSFYRALGYDVRANQIKPDGAISWRFASDEEDIDYDQFDVILHQVRNPLNCVYALGTVDYNTSHHISRGINAYLPEDSIDRYKRIHKGMKIWHPWNAMCEKKAVLSYRVEDLRPGTDTVAAIAALLGFDPADAPDVPYQWDSTDNALDATVLEMRAQNPLLEYNLVALAKSYGYVL